MRVTRDFVALVERADMKPEDFFMVESGWFHAYCQKINNQSQYTGSLEPDKHMIPVSRFEMIERLPQDHPKHERDRHLNIYTSQTTRIQPKVSKNVELFLYDCPPGSIFIPYWLHEEQRAQRDVYVGRMALYDIRQNLTGWAFEMLKPDSFGMCFQNEGDAILFAAMQPAIREEMKDKRKLKQQSLSERKLPW